MPETTIALLALGCFVLTVVVFLAAQRRSQRRREESFALLAAHCGASVEQLSESSFRFVTTSVDRELEVRDAYRGGGLGSSSSGSQYFTTATSLRGRAWDLHSVDITRRRKVSEPFDVAFKVEDLGLPMREGWLTPTVRSAIAAAFVPEHTLYKISIDAGQLVFWLRALPGKLSPATLESILSSNADLAARIERAR